MEAQLLAAAMESAEDESGRGGGRGGSWLPEWSPIRRSTAADLKRQSDLEEERRRIHRGRTAQADGTARTID